MKCITKNNFLSILLVASKSKVNLIKGKISIPRLELLGSLILSCLILTIFCQGEIVISYLHARTDFEVSLAWIKALNKEFQTFIQNQVVQIRKQILNEFRNEFWINRRRNYIRKLLNICFLCKRLQSRSYREKSNLPGYRGNRTVPFQVCGVDYLRPVFVNPIQDGVGPKQPP